MKKRVVKVFVACLGIVFVASSANALIRTIQQTGKQLKEHTQVIEKDYKTGQVPRGMMRELEKRIAAYNDAIKNQQSELTNEQLLLQCEKKYCSGEYAHCGVFLCLPN